MTSIIDSHCHLNSLELNEPEVSIKSYIDAAKSAGVVHMLNVCISLEAFDEVLQVAKQHPEVSASVGMHPNENPDYVVTVEELIALASDDDIKAIGETGLDYYRSSGDMTWQQQRFRNHITAAKTCAKPIIVHTRDAPEDTIRIMQEESAGDVGGVMHCFTESTTMAGQALDMGFYISLSGIVTFKNAHQVHELAHYVPLDRLLIETDAPYLAPMPYRGKPNQPAYVKYVAERIAQLRNISFEEVAQQTFVNTNELFNLNLPHC